MDCLAMQTFNIRQSAEWLAKHQATQEACGSTRGPGITTGQ